MRHLIIKSGDGKDEFIEIPSLPSLLSGYKQKDTHNPIYDFEKAVTPVYADQNPTTFHINPIIIRYLYPAWIKFMKREYRRLRGAKWIWSNFRLSTKEAQKGGKVIYKRFFKLPENITIAEASIYITVDNTYDLYVNGSKDDPKIGKFDNWEELKSHFIKLKPGINEFAIYASNEAQGERATPESNPGGIIMRAHIKYARESIISKIRRKIRIRVGWTSLETAILIIGNFLIWYIPYKLDLKEISSAVRITLSTTLSGALTFGMIFHWLRLARKS